MNIAVNTKLLIKDRLEGIGWFEYETLSRITRAHPEHRFFFIFDRKWDEAFIFSENVHPIRTILPSRHPVLWYLRFHHMLPRLVTKHKIDLFFSPDGYNLPSPVRSVIALHDLNYVHFPGNLPPLTRQYYRKFFPEYARNANRLVTVSEYSKQDIVRSYGIDPDRIDVVYNGASPVFRPLSELEKQSVRAKYASGKPYFIFVGALNPRKNLVRLLKAFDGLCSEGKTDMQLLIAGAPMFRNSFFRPGEVPPACGERVRFLGRLSREELARVVGGARSLVLPSTFEGFGIPIIEAMYCDVPVITSNTTSMPEVAGDAALLVDPYSVGSIGQALTRMAMDPGLRGELITKGRKQRELFSWDKTARLLWESLENAMIT
jgi:glycosyltransferase involved in cell wall biosynthesis